MADVQDLEAKKTARWAKAEKYAQGFTDRGMSRALTVYYTRFFPLITLAAIGLALGIAFIRSQGAPVDGLFAAWLSTYLFAVGTAIGGFSYNSKRLKPSVELGSTLSIVMPLEKEEQRAIMRGINGEQSVPDEHVTIARSVAVQSRKNTATMLLVGPFNAMFLGPMFSSPSMLASVGWFYLLMFAAVIAVLIYGIRSFQRQGRFLTASAPVPDPAQS